MSSSTDPLGSLCSSLLDQFVTELCLDVALEAHSEIKRGRLICNICGTLCKASSGSHCPPVPTLVPATASPSSSSRSNTPLPTTPVFASKRPQALEKDFNQPTYAEPVGSGKQGNIFFDCVHCSKPIASTRYAPHLSKCLGLGGRRTTGRSVVSRLGKTGSEAGSDAESVSSKSKMKGLNGNAKRTVTPTKASSLSSTTTNNAKRQKTSNSTNTTPVLSAALPVPLAPPPPTTAPPPPPPPPPPPQVGYGGATPPRLQSRLVNGFGNDDASGLGGGFDSYAVDGDLVDSDSSGDDS